jgi:hypothetical protein
MPRALSPFRMACSEAAQPATLLDRKGVSIRARGKRALIRLLRANYDLTADDKRVLADLLDGKLKRRGRPQNDQWIKEINSQVFAFMDDIIAKKKFTVEEACAAALKKFGFTLDAGGDRVERFLNRRRESQRTKKPRTKKPSVLIRG